MALQALHKSLDILELVCSRKSPVSLAEITAACGMKNPTAHNMVKTLVERGYLRQVGPRQGYTIGPALIDLSWHLRTEFFIFEMMEEHLKILQQKVGNETCWAAYLRGYTVVPFINLVSPRVLALKSVEPYTILHATALGKVFLAYMSPQRRKYWFEHAKLNSVTPHTIIDVAQLEKELQLIRERGYAINDAESEEGVLIYAVPILGEQVENIEYAIAVGLPTARATPEAAEKIPALLLDTASAISQVFETPHGYEDRVASSESLTPRKMNAERKGKGGNALESATFGGV
jgi:DNA-binding IclR family transcriptional regulator